MTRSPATSKWNAPPPGQSGRAPSSAPRSRRRRPRTSISWSSGIAGELVEPAEDDVRGGSSQGAEHGGQVGPAVRPDGVADVLARVLRDPGQECVDPVGTEDQARVPEELLHPVARVHAVAAPREGASASLEAGHVHVRQLDEPGDVASVAVERRAVLEDQEQERALADLLVLVGRPVEVLGVEALEAGHQVLGRPRHLELRDHVERRERELADRVVVLARATPHAQELEVAVVLVDEPAGRGVMLEHEGCR